ncbi:MAG: hypothetical protein LCH46_06740 [Proteobacteria bacterium]|nr:hypothetical protein [Pseudomonadota bacterium]
MDDPRVLIRLRKAQQQLIDQQKAELAPLHQKFAALEEEALDCVRVLGRSELSIALVTTSLTRRMRRIDKEKRDLAAEIAVLEKRILQSEMRRDKISELIAGIVDRQEWQELEELQLEHLSQAVARSSFTQDRGPKLA